MHTQLAPGKGTFPGSDIRLDVPPEQSRTTQTLSRRSSRIGRIKKDRTSILGSVGAMAFVVIPTKGGADAGKSGREWCLMAFPDTTPPPIFSPLPRLFPRNRQGNNGRGNGLRKGRESPQRRKKETVDTRQDWGGYRELGEGGGDVFPGTAGESSISGTSEKLHRVPSLTQFTLFSCFFYASTLEKGTPRTGRTRDSAAR